MIKKLPFHNWCNEHEITLTDLENISNDININWSKLREKKILVTGATGSIGSSLVKSLLYTSIKNNLNLKIYAISRKLEKLKDIFYSYVSYLNKNLFFIEHDLSNPFNYNINFDFIVHGASITDSQTMIDKPVETIDIIYTGTKNLLEYCKKNNIESFIFLSSLEVYGKLEKEEIYELDFGNINFINLRSSYSESKRLAELMCKSYFSEYNIPIKIVRLTQSFGTAITVKDQRMYAQFINSALEKRSIILHTKGNTKREYIYIFDVVHYVILLLIEGKYGDIYNISNNNNYISVLDIAKKITEMYNLPEVIFQTKATNKKYLEDIKIRLNCDKIKRLSYFTLLDLESMISNAYCLTKIARNLKNK